MKIIIYTRVLFYLLKKIPFQACSVFCLRPALQTARPLGPRNAQNTGSKWRSRLVSSSCGAYALATWFCTYEAICMLNLSNKSVEWRVVCTKHPLFDTLM